MKKCLTLCLLLAFMMVASNGVCAIVGDNLVDNGGFDQLEYDKIAWDKKGTKNKKKLSELPLYGWDVYNKIPGWKTVRGPGIEVQRNTMTTAHSGEYYVELDSKSNSSMTQSLYLDEPGTYQLSFFYMAREEEKTDGSNLEDNRIDYSIDNGSILKEGYISTFYKEGTPWYHEIMDFTIGEDSGTDFNLTFKANGHSNSLGGFIDTVSVYKTVATPIPSSLALLLSGVAGFVVLNRKKAMN